MFSSPSRSNLSNKTVSTMRVTSVGNSSAMVGRGTLRFVDCLALDFLFCISLRCLSCLLSRAVSKKSANSNNVVNSYNTENINKLVYTSYDSIKDIKRGNQVQKISITIMALVYRMDKSP